MKKVAFVNITKPILVMVFTVLSLKCGMAQPNKADSPDNIYREGGNRYPAYYSFEWMNEKWTGDETPYRNIRIQIEKLQAIKSLSDKIIASYKSAYLRKPQDSKLFFRWAYAIEYKPSNGKWRELANDLVTNHFWKIPSPKTYEYSRLRWLTQATVGPTLSHDQEKLASYGEKLLKRNAKDIDVLYHLVDYVGIAKSVVYAERLMQVAPKAQSSFATLAFAYFKMFLKTHTQKDADRAVGAYQRLLTVIPVSDKNGRKSVERTIKHIQSVRGRWANKVR